MRYAIVTETWPPEVNGVALTVQSLADGLRQRGHDLEVVRPRQPRDGAAGEGERLVASLPLPRYPGLRFGLPAMRMLATSWGRHRPDAIYVATEGPLGWSALRAARRLSIPVATGFHTRFDRYMRDYGAPRLEALALRWMRGFHNRAQATLVPTEALLQELRALGFEKATRLPRAVDTTLFHPRHRDEALRASWGLRAEDLAVIHVGRIAPEKNLALAVRAFRTLQRTVPHARFVWVGDGPAREGLQREHPDFIFCGVQRGETLARHFASADLFLFPSRSETYGNVTLEALASGLPTVAFDYGAAHEYLRDGVHGAAVRDDDPDDVRDADERFVQAAIRIGRDPDLRARMRLAARDAVSMLRPERVAADFDLLLQSLAHSDPAHERRSSASTPARQ
jgi:glycosyltransferase involved in cell wall biosynthesis